MTEIYLGIADLVDRWCYTRQGVHNLIKDSKFPTPFASINRGRNPLWTLSNIEEYEKKHPEVLSVEAKNKKIKGYARAIMKKKNIDVT